MGSETSEKSWEPSEEEVKASLQELHQSIVALATSPLDAFAVLLNKWDTWEGERVQALEDWNLRHELGADKNEVARRYALSKGRLLAVERRLVERLKEMSEDEREMAFSKGFVLQLSGFIKVVACKKELRGRLRVAVLHTDGKQAV